MDKCHYASGTEVLLMGICQTKDSDVFLGSSFKIWNDVLLSHFTGTAANMIAWPTLIIFLSLSSKNCNGNKLKTAILFA